MLARNSAAAAPVQAAAEAAGELTGGVGALGIGVARLHKRLDLLQVSQLEEVQAVPLELIIIELKSSNNRDGSRLEKAIWIVMLEIRVPTVPAHPPPSHCHAALPSASPARSQATHVVNHSAWLAGALDEIRVVRHNEVPQAPCSIKECCKHWVRSKQHHSLITSRVVECDEVPQAPRSSREWPMQQQGVAKRAVRGRGVEI